MAQEEEEKCIVCGKSIKEEILTIYRGKTYCPKHLEEKEVTMVDERSIEMSKSKLPDNEETKQEIIREEVEVDEEQEQTGMATNKATSYAKGAGAAGLRVGWNGAKSIGGAVASGPPRILSFIGKLLFSLSKWILFLIIFAVLVLFVLFVFNSISGGTFNNVFSKLGINIGESSVGRTVESGALSIFDIIANPEKLTTAYSWESEVIKNSDRQDLGLFFESFTLSPVNGVYRIGDRILATIRLKVNSLDETTDVGVSCKLQDYKRDPFIIAPRRGSEQFQGEYEFIAYKDQSTIFQIGCEFPEGVSVGNFEEGKYNSDSKQKIETKKLTFRASSDLSTRAFFEIWSMDEQELNKLRLENKNPFEGINTPLRRFDGTFNSEYGGGPVELGIVSRTQQPFVPDTFYFFEVRLKPAGASWVGNRRDLLALDLHVPDGVILNERTCDFIPTQRFTDQGYEVYGLKSDLLQKANSKCTGDVLDIFSDDCIKKLKEELGFFCEFKLVESIDRIDRPEFVSLRAEVRYQYEITSSKALTFDNANSNLT